MKTFEIGETVICSITVKDEDGALQDAATSMQIKIDREDGDKGVILAATNMGNDGTGLYHYDFATAGKAVGKYKVTFMATDGTRITWHEDIFALRT